MTPNDFFRFVLPPTAALILDLENIGIMDCLEAVLEKQAKYPLATRMAVANFANRPKASQKLHSKMYSMIHVPKFSNSADAQMITTGCLLSLNNPQTKEVFICSNDQIFSSLQKTLVHLGKEVHMVTRTGDKLYVDGELAIDSSTIIPKPVQINTINDLVEAIMTLIVESLRQENTHAIKTNLLGSKFAQVYGNGVNYFLDRFKVGIKFIDLLKLNPEFMIIKQDKEYYVCLTQVSAKI